MTNGKQVCKCGHLMRDHHDRWTSGIMMMNLGNCKVCSCKQFTDKDNKKVPEFRQL